MKKKISFVLTALFAVVLALLVFPTNKKLLAAEGGAAQVVSAGESSWLLDNEPYESNILAGTTSGYGDFVLNDRDVEIIADAYKGYSIVGWYIVFENGNREFITQTSSFESLDGYDIEFAISNTDTNKDGYFENSVLKISRIAENYRIEPVFDYIYYKLDISSFFNWASAKYTRETFNGVSVYYTAKEQNENGEFVFSNAVVLLSGKAYYYGTLYLSEDQTSLYTKHIKHDYSDELQKIDVINGAYRINESVEADFKINITEDYDFSTNIELKKINLLVNNNEVDLNGKVNFSTDKRTESFSFEINFANLDSVEKHNSNVLTVKLDYNQLYLVELEPYVDGYYLDYDKVGYNDKLIPYEGVFYDTDSRKLILQDVVGNFAYYTFPNVTVDGKLVNVAKYWVKKEENNDNKPFVVSYRNTVYLYENYLTYNYYTFASLSNDNMFANISSNLKVRLNYTSVKHRVEFKGALLIEGNSSATLLEDLRTPAAFSLKRGESNLLLAAFAPNNRGYQFYCYSPTLTSNDWEQTANDYGSEYTVLMDGKYPTAKTVYLIYKYVDYTVKVSGINSLKVDYNNNTYYPINRLTLSVGGNVENATFGRYKPTDSMPDNTLNATWLFNKKVNINDEFSLQVLANTGFRIAGFEIDGVVYPVGTTFLVNDLILDETKEISFVVSEEFVEYKLTYQINTGTVAEGVSAVMADITLNVAGKDYVANETTESGSEEVEIANGRKLIVTTEIDESNSNKIIVEGLRLFDVVRFEALGRPTSESAGSAIYQFTQFYYGQSVKLQEFVDEATKVYSASLAVSEDNSVVTVMYSTPKAGLSVSVSHENALDLLKDITIVDENGTSYALDSDFSVDLLVTLKYTLSFESRVNKGYQFVSFNTTLNGTTINSSTVSFNFDFLGANDIKYAIEIEFSEIEYRLEVNQIGGGDRNNTLVKFSENGVESDYKIITVSDHNVSFVMPDGYYVGAITVRSASGYVSIAGLETNQNNDYASNLFDLDLPIFETLLGYVRTVGTVSTLNLQVEYTIHTYKVQINYGISNAKGNEDDLQISYPEIELSYVYNDRPYTVVGEYAPSGLFVIFAGVQYGSEFSLQVAGSPRLGMRLDGWVVTNGNVTSFDENSLSGIVYNDTNLIYNLAYIDYEIKIIKEAKPGVVADLNLVGDPYVEVGGVRTNVVHIMDNMNVYANPSKTYGYTHYKMYYNVYKPYTYNSSTWGQDWRTLFFIQDGRFVPATSTHNNIDYFRLVREETNYSTLLNLKYDYNLEFYVEDAVVKDAIVIYVVYDYLQVTLAKTEQRISNQFIAQTTLYKNEASDSYYENKNVREYKLDNIGVWYTLNSVKRYLVLAHNANELVDISTLLVDDPTGYFEMDGENIVYYKQVETNFTLSGVGDLVGDNAIEVEDYAETEIYINDTELYDGSYTLTYLDNVSIYIKFNSINLDGVSNTLDKGVEIKYVDVLGKLFSATMVEDNVYCVRFNVLEVLTNIGDDNRIIYDINYAVKQKNLKFRTNIDDASFYNEGKNFNLWITKTDFNSFEFADMPLISGVWRGGEIELNAGLQYLARVKLSYFSTYDDFLTPVMLRAYVGDKVVATSAEELANYGVFVTYRNGKLFTMEYRYFDDITLELVLQPNFKFNGELINDAWHYFKDYRFTINDSGEDAYIVGETQPLRFGRGSEFDIQADNNGYFANRVKITYYSGENFDIVSTPENAGTYKAVLEFAKLSDSDVDYPSWLDKLELEYEIYLTINPVEVELNLNISKPFEKEYDKSSGFNADELLANVTILANGQDVTRFFTFNKNSSTGYYANITTTIGEDGERSEEAVSAANELPYNLTLYRLRLVSSLYGGNFTLSNTSKTFENAVIIKKRKLTISGLDVLDKVYDGTTSAKIGDYSGLRLNGGIMQNDDVNINYNNIVASFESAEVGEGIKVNLSLDNLLYGNSVSNYEVEGLTRVVRASIYPYSVSLNLDGVGTVTIYNNRGRTDSSLASLIPIGAELVVTSIVQDTPTYSRMYSYIAPFLSNTNVFNKGYQLKFSVTEGNVVTNFKVDNRLYLELPGVNKLNSVLYLSEDNNAGRLNYTMSGDNMLIDLSSTPDVDRIVLTVSRTMFAWWQILLIILLIVAIIAIIVTIIIVNRYKKLRLYRRHDKI